MRKYCCRHGRDFYQGYPVLTHKKPARKGAMFIMWRQIWERNNLLWRLSGKGSRGSRCECCFLHLYRKVFLWQPEKWGWNICVYPEFSEKEQKQFLSRGLQRSSRINKAENNCSTCHGILSGKIIKSKNHSKSIKVYLFSGRYTFYCYLGKKKEGKWQVHQKR